MRKDVPRAEDLTPERGAPPRAVELEMLYRDQRLTLMRFFARSWASADEASDLTQEAFMKLSASDAMRAGQILNPRAYLLATARNLLRNRAKAAMRHLDAAHVDIHDHPVAGPSELSRLEARDSLARLEVAMRSMKPKTREIYMASRLDGMTYPEIAEHTGMSVKGVEKQISRALAHLDRVLDLR
ncbi:RNA polymerase sigma factor [Sphingomonas glacialis]|uniref:RNA polymerase sigma factor n=1 Tax=Sphingomonas glacialis TaxID=658225 RepID=UPI001386FC4B|nr:sigma-70 family RNA polymerase sigma factor [Sphingomonas glacialis]